MKIKLPVNSVHTYLYELMSRNEPILITLKNGQSFFLDSFKIGFDQYQGISDCLVGYLPNGQEIMINVNHVSTVIVGNTIRDYEKYPCDSPSPNCVENLPVGID